MKQESKKILIVSRSMFPVNSPRSFRTTELVKELARQAHDVTLYVLKNHDVHPQFEKEHGVTIKDLGPLSFSGIETTGKSRLMTLFRRALRRGLYQLFEYPDIEMMWKTKHVLEKESGYDLLITIAVPHPIHWGTAWAWKGDRSIATTWVADCGDPYMGATLDTFNKLFYFKYFEKAFCRKADFITVPIESAKEGYYPEFWEKIEVIPQGFRFDEVEINKDGRPENDVPTFAYAGGLIPGGRDPRAFLGYLVSLKQDYHCIFYTQNRNMVAPYIDRSGGKIEIRDYIPRKELLQTLSEMDFLLNFENDTQLQLPSKLIDYYLTGRPVLSVKSGSVPEKRLQQFLKRDYSGKFHFENMDKYRIENICHRFLMLQEKKESNE
jgi:hypothetical protein